jgi:hypothetical protein
LFPNKKEWANWTALEKATFVSLIIAPLSLLVSGLFSYLTWKEAKSSAEIQLRLFVAQNAPRIEISGTRVYEIDNGTTPSGIWAVELTNSGKSEAYSICMSMLIVPETSSFDNTCDRDNSPLQLLQLKPSEQFELDLWTTFLLSEKIGFIANKATFYSGEDQIVNYDEKDIQLILFVSYQDVIGNIYTESKTVILEPEK